MARSAYFLPFPRKTLVTLFPANLRASLKRVSSWIANGFRNWITKDKISDAGCTFRALRKSALAEIPVFNGMHRFLPTLLRFQGYTVVDVDTVIATHLSKILQSHAHELLGREEVQQLLDNLSKSAPKLVEGLVPDTIPLGGVQKVLQNLLEENIPVRDIRTIIESISEQAIRNPDPEAITASTRMALSHSIIQHVNGIKADLPIITLDPELEQILLQTLQATGEGGASLEPGLAENMHKNLYCFLKIRVLTLHRLLRVYYS